MKRLILALFLSLSFGAFAQNTSNQTVADEKPKKKRRMPSTREMVLLNFNFDSWLNTPSTVKPKWFASRGVDVAVLYDYVIAKSTFSLGLGVGFNSHNIQMEAFPIEYQVRDNGRANTETHSYTMLDPKFFDGQKITVNKISTNFIDIPFEVRFRSKSPADRKKLTAAIGFKIGWLVQSHTKTKVDEDYYYQGVNFGRKVKTYDIPNLTKFRYGVSARIGYANYYLSFFYSLTPLFVKGRGTEATPISIGIGVSPF